jgi:hypothetical protein
VPDGPPLLLSARIAEKNCATPLSAVRVGGDSPLTRMGCCTARLFGTPGNLEMGIEIGGDTRFWLVPEKR